jgi:hypothetical protein
MISHPRSNQARRGALRWISPENLRICAKAGEIMATNEDRIEHIFKFIEYDNLTDAQHDLVISFEQQFKRKGSLSDRQLEILEDIFERAA